MSKERELLKRFMHELKTEEDVVSLFNDIKECLAQPEKAVAECTNSDTWNCKYCNKTESCGALKDSRNFAPPKQPESTAEAIMPNGVCISNVYAAYEAGRKSVMSEQEPLTNEQKSAEAALEQALRDTVDEERIRQIIINCISYN